MNGMPGKIREDSIALLDKWAASAEKYWVDIPGQTGLGAFGSGYNGWGVQTNQKYLGAMAVLSQAESKPGGFDRGLALQRALASLRFSLASHLTGNGTCTDGTQWGNTWISGLGIERMMHGVDLLEPHLTDADREALKNVLESEANFQMTSEIFASPWNGAHKNRPESNVWNGAICARAAMMYPDHANCDKWLEQAYRYFINAISVAKDAQDETIVNGKPVKDRHIDANFFPNYALDHHGYLNVGYMVICISNIAMLHYAYKLRGKEAPESLYHHAKDLWNLIRRLIFSDGRLLRIGGDTRQRYCYCQDYLLPSLFFAADYLKDENALALIDGGLNLIREESAYNNDGAFLSKRLDHLEKSSSYYYTRLESDKAVVISMIAHWLDKIPLEDKAPKTDFESSIGGLWHEPEHGGVFHRSPTRMASWSWRAAERPQGMCLPPDNGHMAEWGNNLAGLVEFQDAEEERTPKRFDIKTFDGGFVTGGEFMDGAKIAMKEGWNGTDAASHRIVFAALPDDHTAVRLEYALLAPRRAYINRVYGVKLEIPNDLFNDNTRRYFLDGHIFESNREGKDELIPLKSRWVNIEEKVSLIGIYGAENWTLVKRANPIGGQSGGSLNAEALCWQAQSGLFSAWGPQAILDNACVIYSSMNASDTQKLASGEGKPVQLACSGENSEACRAVMVQAVNGKQYIVAANFSDADTECNIEVPQGEWKDIVSGEVISAGSSIQLPFENGRVFVKND